MKTILITGANRGIGLQLALSYAAPDVNLILIARNETTLKETVLQCQRRGATTFYAAIDVRDALPLKTFILEMDKKNPVDLIIANAGVSATLQPNWQQESIHDTDRVFQTNVNGTMNTINPLIHSMISRKTGQIAIMSSLAAWRGMPQSPSYSSSKAAILVYGQSLRSWLARYHIKANVICPGYIKTDMSNRLNGPKPFLVSSEKAAHLIQHGLRKNKACIAFPWPLRLLTTLSTRLPARMVDGILNQFESYAHEE